MNGPAFPQRGGPIADASGSVCGYLGDSPGMTLRDYFAAKAMEGQIAGDADATEDCYRVNIARFSYAMADAMLAARQEGATQTAELEAER